MAINNPIATDDRPADVGYNPGAATPSAKPPTTVTKKAPPRTDGGPSWYKGKIPWDRVLFQSSDGTNVTWGDLLDTYGPGFEFTTQDASGAARTLFVLDPNMSLDDWFGSGDGGDLSPADYIAGAYKDSPSIGEDGDGSSGGSGSIGGGYSSTSQQYTKPPEDSVREQIKAYVVATTGTANKQVIDRAVEAYMQADKQSFDRRDTEQIDPWQVAKDNVRGTSAYRAVNDGRPDSVDELEWVTGMQAKLRQLGISAARAEQMGIDAAIGGSTDEALTGQANMAQVQDTGRMLKQQRNELKQSAAAAARLI